MTVPCKVFIVFEPVNPSSSAGLSLCVGSFLHGEKKVSMPSVPDPWEARGASSLTAGLFSCAGFFESHCGRSTTYEQAQRPRQAQVLGRVKTPQHHV